ncbi:hypothetical protein Btru_019759 [Bulinus truncatus]|nr:hypothetical protein Btru_019759 [Bulinus truncatus]
MLNLAKSHFKMNARNKPRVSIDIDEGGRLSIINMFLHPGTLVSLVVWFGHVTADIDSSVLKGYSPACQVTVSTQDIDLPQCTSMCDEMYEAFVKLGFCTDSEFNGLKAVVCTGGDVGSGGGGAGPISETKRKFYEALNQMPSPCLTNALRCILLSAVGIILKQQEQYCSLMNMNLNNVAMESCLASGSSGCALSEFKSLKSAACVSGKTSAAEHGFSDALLTTSGQCQSRLYSCTHDGGHVKYFNFEERTDAVNLVAKERYCEFLRYQVQGKSLEACLKASNNSCTSTEFDLLKAATCSSAMTLTHSVVAIVLGSTLSGLSLG